jgi:beta-lactam-binding protein with PASTA domain/predicted Ser/Thr protein kinase
MTDPRIHEPAAGREDVIIDGRYRLLRRVGSGGMADVWCAEDLQLGRQVALKLLHRRFSEDPEFVERFKREASSAASLQHPNVVSVYDRGEFDGTYYIAMEYLDGRPLKQVVREEAPLDPLRAIDLTVQILRAARFAHQRGVVHRDIKPHNVIVDDEGRAKVTDFGIARAGASDMTETGSIMGTAQYLSPEQAQGHAVSPQSDLYAIGIVLYEMLTGRVPFDGESAVTIALKQVSETPVPPSAWNPAVPPELDAIVMRALEKDPAARFISAEEFIGALQGAADRIASGEAVAPGTVAFVAVGGDVPPPVQDITVYASSEEPDGEGRKRRRWPWIVAAIALLCIAGALIALAATGAFEGTPRVVVPRVVGLNAATAQTVLERSGFKADIQRFVNPAPPDEVFGQDPGAGAKADKGSTVVVRVSQGPAQTVVPDVVGDSSKDAKKALKEAGFKVKTQQEFSESVPQGSVIRTIPGAGEKADQGSEVTIVVSKGTQPVTVPDVVGDSRDTATSTLQNAGFKVDTTAQESSDVSPGTVVSQNPTAGTSAGKGSTVTITVAKAPPQVDVPNEIGQRRTPATEDLRAAGFKVAVDERPVTDQSEDGTVVAQDPSGGKADKGSTVTITIGRFPTSNPTTP